MLEMARIRPTDCLIFLKHTVVSPCIQSYIIFYLKTKLMAVAQYCFLEHPFLKKTVLIVQEQSLQKHLFAVFLCVNISIFLSQNIHGYTQKVTLNSDIQEGCGGGCTGGWFGGGIGGWFGGGGGGGCSSTSISSSSSSSSSSCSKSKAVPLQPWAGPETSRWLRLPDFSSGSGSTKKNRALPRFLAKQALSKSGSLALPCSNPGLEGFVWSAPTQAALPIYRRLR